MRAFVFNPYTWLVASAVVLTTGGRIYLITNAPASELKDFGRWIIVDPR